MGCSTVLRLLLSPAQLVAVLRARALVGEVEELYRIEDAALAYCYQALGAVSRSFAVVISRLPPPLRDGICIFYLVLRALDTVEDDMAVPVDRKQAELPVFYRRLVPGGHCRDLSGIGDGHEAELLERFEEVTDVYQRLPPAQQEIVSDICRRMGEGMAEFAVRPVQTHEDWDLYCHYVAGLVGHGLTRLWVASGHEPPSIAADLGDANEMGLFLQKTNIIRDYREDADADPPRVWWPRDAWQGVCGDVRDLREPRLRGDAVRILNALIANALGHLPQCVRYLWSLRDAAVFTFCAVPQVMAVATLALVYDNPQVIEAKVKVSKGRAAQIMVGCATPQEAAAHITSILAELERKARKCSDPSAEVLLRRIAAARAALAAPQPELVGDAAVPSLSRQFITRYPALGGQMLYNIVDSLGRVFKTGQQLPARCKAD